MIKLAVLSFSLLLFLIHEVSGNAAGANTDACVTLTPGHGVLAQTSASPWTITASATSYSIGQTMEVTVQATGGQQYRGLLLQARPVGSNTPVGTWTTTVGDTQQMTCMSANDGITHSASSLKPLTVTFTWIPPSASVGSIEFHGTFVAAFSVYWVDVVSSVVTEVSETNECASGPCLNGATCADVGSAYVCTCTSQYSGVNCETFIETTTPCSTNPCQNGGTCVEGVSSYTCTCTSGYTGDNCQTSSGEPGYCESNPNLCQNNGVCVNTGTWYMCECPSGYMGTNCETGDIVTPCDSAPCFNGGTCMNIGTTSYTCNCPSTYTGNQCQTPVSTTASCSPNPCSYGGTCSLSGNYYKCDCPLGTSGDNCQTLLSSGCSSNSCGVFGTCQTLSTGGYYCICSNSYSGDTCNDAPAAYCGVGQCQQNAACSLSGSYYQCDCPTGYSGQNCELTTSACDGSPCLNGAICNTVSSNAYSCSCTSGYGGSDCGSASSTYCSIFNPCSSTSQQCTLSGNWYKCV